MKCVEAMLPSGICRPCLTAIQQDAEDTGLVHLNPRVQCVYAIFPHPLGQSGHGGRSFADAFFYPGIGGQVACDG